MASLYCDFSTGDDTTGAGTSAAPWKTYAKCIASAGAGDIIYIANTAAQTLTSSINLATLLSHGSGTSPITTKAWDNGGSITTETPTGTVTGAEIDGNDAVATIFTWAYPDGYMVFEGVKFHSTTGTLVNASLHWNFKNCEFYDCGGIELAKTTYNGGLFANCLFRDDGGSSVDGITCSTAATVLVGCEFRGLSGSAMAGYNFTAIECLIHDVDEDGIKITLWDARIINCTIDGSGVAGKHGINCSIYDNSYAYNNLVTNWSGTGSFGIKWAGGVNLRGPNAFYNNTTNQSTSGYGLLGADYTADDVIETADPYTDRSADDYSLTASAASVGAGKAWLSAAGQPDFGAIQRAAATGGGGIIMPSVRSF